MGFTLSFKSKQNLKIKRTANETMWFSHTEPSFGPGSFKQSLQKGSRIFVYCVTTSNFSRQERCLQKPLQILGTERVLSFVCIFSYQGFLT